MSTRTALVALNTLSSYARFAVLLAVQFFLIPFVIVRVGVTDYGIWSLTLSVLGFFTLLDFGFSPGVVKYVARARGTGDVEARNRMVSTIAAVYAALAVLALLALAVLAATYDRLFDIPPDQQRKALALLWILGLRAVTLTLPLGLFRGVLYGDQRIYVINLIQVVGSLVHAAAIWGFLSAGHGIVAMAAANFGTMLLEHAAYVLFAYRSVTDLRVSWRLADRALLKEATSFGFFQFLVSVSALVLLRTDPILVKIFLSLEAVAVYAVALKIAENALLVVKQFVNVLTPVAAQLGGEGNEAKLELIVINGSKLAFAPAVVIAVGSWVFGSDAIRFWVGPSFAGAGPVLMVLATAVALSMPQAVISGVFSMTGRHRFTATAAAASMVLNIVLSLLLARPFGLTGIAAGTLGASLVVDVVAVVVAACRRFGVSYAAFFRRVYLAGVVPGAAQYVVSAGLKAWLPPQSLGAVLLEALPGVLAFMVLFWMLHVERFEKELLRRKLFARPARGAVALSAPREEP